jgi:hypothetical protein
MLQRRTELLWVHPIKTLSFVYSLICLIPVLHPRHKLAYFKSAGWEDDWIETAEKLVRDRFESDYSEIKTLDACLGTSDTEVESQLVRHARFLISVFLALLTLITGALGSLTIGKHIRQPTILWPSQTQCLGRRAHSLPQCRYCGHN